MQNFKRLLQMQDWSTENHTTTKTTNQLFLVMVTVATREVMEGFFMRSDATKIEMRSTLSFQKMKNMNLPRSTESAEIIRYVDAKNWHTVYQSSRNSQEIEMWQICNLISRHLVSRHLGSYLSVSFLFCILFCSFFCGIKASKTWPKYCIIQVRIPSAFWRFST